MNNSYKFRDIVGVSTKVESYSFFEYGKVIKKGLDNQVFLNKKILEEENINIQLDKDIDLYLHNVEESKILLRSMMLMDLYKCGNNNLKNKLNGANFFFTRETICNLANVSGCSKTTFWAFVLDGVIVIIKEYNKDKNLFKNIKLDYFDHFFINTITSKDGLGKLNFSKRVNNFNQYVEIYTTDFSMPNKTVIRVAHSCKVDAIDRKTKTPIKIETQNILPLSLGNLTSPKLNSIYLKCMLTGIQTVVVGNMKDNKVHMIRKYPVESLLNNDDCAYVTRCCEKLYEKLEKIKTLFYFYNNKGCIKIHRNVSNNIISLEYFPDICPEIRRLFTIEFCNKFF